MQLSEATIDAAFEKHAKRYGGERLWRIPDHVDCWSHAREAFENGSTPAFEWLYSELRTKWQVFRSRNWNPPTPKKVQVIMNGLPASLRSRRLVSFAEPTPEDLLDLWRAMTDVAAIKKNRDGPSLVAVTKFLHFWNPRLFVIADRQVVWNWVFEHRWLWQQVERGREELAPKMPTEIQEHRFYSNDFRDYLAVLVWGGRVMRDNPSLPERFALYVEKESGQPAPVNLQAYEGAALEWLLLGLVELPPAGVSAQG